MPAWKVVFIAALAIACFGLASATAIFPTTDMAGKDRWLWLAGLAAAAAAMTGLFVLVLRRASAAMQWRPGRSSRNP